MVTAPVVRVMAAGALVARRACAARVMAATLAIPRTAVMVITVAAHDHGAVTMGQVADTMAVMVDAPDRSVVAVRACTGDVAPTMVAVPPVAVVIIRSPANIDGAISVGQGGIAVAAIIAATAVIIGVHTGAQQQDAKQAWDQEEELFFHGSVDVIWCAIFNLDALMSDFPRRAWEHAYVPSTG